MSSAKLLDSWDKLNDTLWDESDTEVHALLSTCCNDLSHVRYDVVKRHILCLYLLTYEGDVWTSLESALKSYVRSRTAHQFDEVPVLLCRVTVTHDVTDNL